MGHLGASGEGMPQDHGGDRCTSGVARMRVTLPRIVFAAALAGVLAGGGISTARAADDGSNDDTLMAKVLQKLGLKAQPDQNADNQNADISYSERSPLVVPPSRDLPPPVAEAPPGADWPKDAAKPRKHVRSKSPPPTPAAVATVPAAPAADGGAAAGQPGQAPQGGQAPAPAQPGQAPQGSQATAPGQSGQAPQGGQAAAPAQTGTVARVPNPTPAGSTWWNPKTWFNREEYATFVTEPARDDLTDPPAGYRTPSPDQPYGVGPERKKNTEQPWTPPVTTKDLPR